MSNQIHSEAFKKLNSNPNKAYSSNSQSQKNPDQHEQEGLEGEALTQKLKHMAEDSMSFVKDNFSEYYNKGHEKVEAVEKNAEAKIKSYPFRSIFIALGVGFALGKIGKMAR